MHRKVHINVPAADKLIGEVSRWQVQNAEKNGTQVNYTQDLMVMVSTIFLNQGLIMFSFSGLSF